MCEIFRQMPVTIYAREMKEIIEIYTATCNWRGTYGR